MTGCASLLDTTCCCGTVLKIINRQSSALSNNGLSVASNILLITYQLCYPVCCFKNGPTPQNKQLSIADLPHRTSDLMALCGCKCEKLSHLIGLQLKCKWETNRTSSVNYKHSTEQAQVNHLTSKNKDTRAQKSHNEQPRWFIKQQPS